MDKTQAIWNERYQKLFQKGLTYPGEPWLGDCLDLVPQGGPRRALDVGCGTGFNTKYLVEQGYEVTAIDFSGKALERCRREIPEARFACVDFREGFQFTNDHFELIVADLSLHYFSWEITVRVFEDIANRLVSGGLFAGRFNSKGDTNYGADSNEPVPGESNLLIVDGIEKRFFTRGCFDELVKPPMVAVSVVEKTTARFGPRKVFWEVLAKKNG